MEDLTGKVVGGCRIESLIGEGGMGAVYKAHHQMLDIPVALKFITNASGFTDVEERFLREAAVAAKLTHDNIARVYDARREEGRLFIVFEYIDGMNLKTLVDKKGKMPEKDVVEIAQAVLAGLQHAWEKGIVHRDIKPENILIDKNGKVKIVDMGLARICANPSITQPDTILGSPFYVAPEQAEHPGEVDCRADIYSLGCTLYHLLAGAPPFPGASMVEVLLQHLKKEVPPLCDVDKRISLAVSATVEKMMAKNPDLRFQTPHEVRDALFGLPVKTVKQKRSPAARKKERRIVLSAAALLICIILFAAYLTVQNVYQQKVVPLKEQVLLQTRIDTTIARQSATTSDTCLTDKRNDTGRNGTSKKTAGQKLTKKTAVQPNVFPSTAQVKTPVKDNVLAAVKIGDAGELSRLLDGGASPDGIAGAASTPLHEAVRRGLTKEASLLLDKGAKVNVRDNRGNTPLHYAVKEDAQFFASLLLKHGADVHLRDKSGKSALELATETGSAMENIVAPYRKK